ncbi:hypothetical protein [Desulfonatronospira sp.]|uniref:hypothetical protein n=1 Tax=Desulfonatronospira sp. TaxID=1962951 RepID=UPI0025BF6F4E|nr:hypothetical protein [Desulfonatronospira sp.]
MQTREDKTREAIKDLSRVFQFELWLRFYFIHDDEGRLSINLDEETLQKMEEKYGHLGQLARTLTGKEITPETCRQTIVEHIMHQFDGTKYDVGHVPRMMDHAVFKGEIQLFNTWAGLHEEQLDRKVLDFEKWIEIYEEWKSSESAQKVNLALNIQDAEHHHPGSDKTN